MTKNENATKQICFRVTPKDHAKLRELADVAGVSMSAYLLACALEPKSAVIVDLGDARRAEELAKG